MTWRLLRSLTRDRRGNVAVTFALAIIPIVTLVGMAIDIANATRIKLALQDATDEAAISLARQAPTIADNQISTTAKSYIQASYHATSALSITSATIDRASITATIDSKVDVPTYFAKLVGVSSLKVTSHSVAKGMLLEIAMVLDTSGSMSQSAGSGGSKISALKTAAGSFLDAMFGTQATSQRVNVAIVPFATNVRVAAQGSSPPSWMDTAGSAPDAFDDLDSTTKTRFQLFSSMSNQRWGGCVMTRPAPYDVTDATASSTTPATLFVPWFAPDEPDTVLSWTLTAYENNYLSDNGGICTGSITGWTDLQKQNRQCKYIGVAPSSSSRGPNYLCDSAAITPLTSTRASLNTAINALQANGDTNIMEGVMWGWRALSPGAPFTEGKAYTAPNNRKVIVLMTDGVNNYNGVNNPNMSYYFTYGFAKDGRIGQATSNNTTLTSLLNGKTLLACANAKAQGITIYTIGFGAGASASTTLLQTCATDPKYAYFPQNSSDLTPVFQKIAQSINSLRIAE